MLNFLLLALCILMYSCASGPATHIEIMPKPGAKNECILRADQTANIDVIGNEVSVSTGQ